MRIRLFGSKNCELCKQITRELLKAGISYQYVDAMVDKNQDYCNRYGVRDLPHIQILNESNAVVHEVVGYATSTQIKEAASRALGE